MKIVVGQKGTNERTEPNESEYISSVWERLYHVCYTRSVYNIVRWWCVALECAVGLVYGLQTTDKKVMYEKPVLISTTRQPQPKNWALKWFRPFSCCSIIYFGYIHIYMFLHTACVCLIVCVIACWPGSRFHLCWLESSFTSSFIKFFEISKAILEFFFRPHFFGFWHLCVFYHFTSVQKSQRHAIHFYVVNEFFGSYIL